MAKRGKKARRGADQVNNRSQAPRKRKRRRAGGRPFKPGQSGNEDTQFKPGESGNPLGRPPLPADYKQAIAILEPEAVAVLREILEDKTHPRREQTAEYVINRTQGRPRQTVELSGPDGKPVKLETDDPVAVMVRAMIAKKAESDGDGDGGGGSAG